jgi:hypothetical protein
MWLSARHEVKGLRRLLPAIFASGQDSNPGQIQSKEASLTERDREDISRSLTSGNAIPSSPSDEAESGPRHLMLADETGEPLVEIAPSSPQSSESSSSSTVLPPEISRGLSSIIEELPQAIDTGLDIAKPQYRVFLKKSFREGVQNGSLEMMKSNGPAGGFRLNVINGETKKIVGQGSIVRSGKWRRYLSGGFQIVSFVAGQSHLAEISQRLNQIETTTEDIRDHLADERQGALKGKIKYMKEVLQTLREADLAPEEVTTFNNQLETVERETLEVIEALSEEFDRRGLAIEDLDPEEFKLFWRLSKNKEQTTDEIDRYSSTVRRLETALWVRLIAAELKTYLPIDHQLLCRRRQSVRDMIKHIRVQHQESIDTAKEKASQLKGSVATEETTQAVREEVDERIEESFGPIKTRLEKMDAIARKGANVLKKRDQLLEQELELELIQKKDGSYQARMIE